MTEDDFPDEIIRDTPDPTDYAFDLYRTLQSMVSVRTRIPEDAMTAPVLGTEREGHGVVINDQGLILTIGYVVTEAESVWLVDHAGTTLPGHVVAYDQESGFGLVQALGKMPLPPIPIGRSASIAVGQPMLLAGSGGIADTLKVHVAGVNEFAGYWEYLIDSAIFTAPAHPSWGGAALIGEDGHLYGIGSLILQTVNGDNDAQSANMIVPIDLLEPILDDLLMYGKRNQPARPWLGWFVHDTRDGPVVAGVADDSPADTAGLLSGDLIIEINNRPVDDLPALYRSVWGTGPAGVDIEVLFERDGQQLATTVPSVDRNARLKSASLH
jgi:S1-C subfamily serine protease